MEAPVGEDTYYLDGRRIPSAEGLWGVMQEALLHRRALLESGGCTDWYYQVSAHDRFWSGVLV